MKIHNPASCGLFLALMSSTQVAAQNQACSTLAECPDNTYCNSLTNTCMDIGGCEELSDCDDPTNTPYPMALCIGTRICANNICGIDCTTDPPPEEAVSEKILCVSHDECQDNQFCASDGICERIGGCANPDDCWLDENQGYPIATCMGSMECADRQCAMNCSGGSDALFACQSSKDCTERDSYCNSYETCRKNGSCNTDADCSMPGNNYPEIECVGTRYCNERGMCAKECGTGGEPEPLPEACTSSDQCRGDDEYCAGNGLCLKHGACDREGDCTNLDNEIFFISCVGTIFCEMGQCGKRCDGAVREPETLPVKGDAADIEIQCARDDDCNPSITTSTARSAPFDMMYCAQGICKMQGDCISDDDCMNPSNSFWESERCLGYLHCTNEGKCDRECQVDCKNGSTAAQCSADMCEVEDWSECEEAVSCVMTTCDEKCGWKLFNEGGKVPIEGVCGSPGATSMEGDAIFKDVDGGLVAPPDDTTQVTKLESSAMIRATSVAASLAVVLAATMV